MADKSNPLEFLSFFRRSSIQKRIFLYFFTFSFLCVIFGFLIITTAFLSRFKTSEKNHSINRTNEAKQNIEFLLNVTNNAASLLASNGRLIKILDETDSTEKPGYYASQREFSEMLINIISVHEYIDNIYVIGNEGEFFTSYWDTDRDVILNRFGGYGRLMEMVSRSYEGKLVSTDREEIDRNSISFIRPVLLYPDDTTLGLIIMDLNYTYLREMFNYSSLKQANEMVLVVNSDGEQLFSFPFNSSLLPIIDEYPGLLRKNTLIEGEVFDRESFLVSSSILYSDWTMIRIISHDDIFRTMHSIRLLGLVIGLVLLFLTFIGSYILSISITKPIIELNNRIGQVKNGNFSVQVRDCGSDEIGQLQSSFNIMVRRINELMRKTLLEQKKKSDMEFEILQAQINPHFLYNTLDSIKWLAVFHNNTNIADMTTSLINLLKYNISRKERLVPLEDEISVIRDYIELQKYRFGDSFAVEFDIEENSRNCFILKFILQPLIENAIFHGFQDMDDQGIIRIRSGIENNRLIITIRDNGQGLKEDGSHEAPGNLNSKKMNTKIGIKNVSDRIHLYFEKEGFFSIENDREGGVIVRIGFPIITDKDRQDYEERIIRRE